MTRGRRGLLQAPPDPRRPECSSCFCPPAGPRHDVVDTAACTRGVDVAAVDLDLRVVDEDGLLAGRACLAGGGGDGFGECLVGRVPGVAWHGSFLSFLRGGTRWAPGAPSVYPSAVAEKRLGPSRLSVAGSSPATRL